MRILGEAGNALLVDHGLDDPQAPAWVVVLDERKVIGPLPLGIAVTRCDWTPDPRLDVLLPAVREVLKHGDHDQSSHGNWATGASEGEPRDQRTRFLPVPIESKLHGKTPGEVRDIVTQELRELRDDGVLVYVAGKAPGNLGNGLHSDAERSALERETFEQAAEDRDAQARLLIAHHVVEEIEALPAGVRQELRGYDLDIRVEGKTGNPPEFTASGQVFRESGHVDYARNELVVWQKASASGGPHDGLRITETGTLRHELGHVAAAALTTRIAALEAADTRPDGTIPTVSEAYKRLSGAAVEFDEAIRAEGGWSLYGEAWLGDPGSTQSSAIAHVQADPNAADSIVVVASITHAANENFAEVFKDYSEWERQLTTGEGAVSKAEALRRFERAGGMRSPAGAYRGPAWQKAYKPKTARAFAKIMRELRHKRDEKRHPLRGHGRRME